MYNDMAKISEYVMKKWPGLDVVTGEHRAKVMELYFDKSFKLSNMSDGIEIVPHLEIQWGE